MAKLIACRERLLTLLKKNYEKFDKLCELKELGKIDRWTFRKRERPILETGRELRTALGYNDFVVGVRDGHRKKSRPELKRVRRCKLGKNSTAKNAKK